MLISIDKNSSVPTYMQLIESVTELIDKGVLTSGEKLPSVRVLAAELVVNPNTIQKAYTELERRGLICRRAGVHGCFVCEKPRVHSGAAERSGTEAERAVAAALRFARLDGVDRERIVAMLDEIYSENN